MPKLPVTQASVAHLPPSAHVDRRIVLHALEDARPYRIRTYHGDARDGYLRSRGFRVDSAPNDLTNPRKLLLGRIDL